MIGVEGFETAPASETVVAVPESITVMEDDTNKVITAHMMPRERLDEHAVARMMQDKRRLGHRETILKSDQGPAIIALREALIRTVWEHHHPRDQRKPRLKPAAYHNKIVEQQVVANYNREDTR